MRADTKADEVLGVGASLGVALAVAKGARVNGNHIGDLCLGSVSHEKRLSSPLHGNTRALRHLIQLDLGTGQGENVLCRRHVSDVLVTITGYTGTDGRGERDRPEVTNGLLGRPELVLVLETLGVAVRRAVRGEVERLDVVAGRAERVSKCHRA